MTADSEEDATVGGRLLRVLCVCWEFPPQITATGLRAAKLLGRLADAGWEVEVVTAADEATLPANPSVRIRHVPQPPSPWSHWLRHIRLGKVLEWVNWLDDRSSWVGPATAAAMTAVAERRPDAIIVFMMPYMDGLVGLELKRRTGLPVVMNFDDSPTCDDMHPVFVSRWHYRRVVAFEDAVVRAADAVVYVSRRNLERVRDRQPPANRGKFHLVRFGGDTPLATDRMAAEPGVFRIIYIGGMTGWHAFGPAGGSRHRSAARRLFRWWERLGRYQLVELDQRGSSPVFVGRAVNRIVEDDPSLAGKIRVEMFGNRNPQSEADDLIEGQCLSDVVRVHGPIPHDAAVAIAATGDLLFIALPARLDNSTGGRISAKSYEYLMTDRPILAAVPRGENEEFLADYQGVTVVRPTDVDGMVSAIRSALAGRLRFTRSVTDLSYDGRAAAFASVIRGVVDGRDIEGLGNDVVC